MHRYLIRMPRALAQRSNGAQRVRCADSRAGRVAQERACGTLAIVHRPVGATTAEADDFDSRSTSCSAVAFEAGATMAMVCV
jgi:hypothetical protein